MTHLPSYSRGIGLGIVLGLCAGMIFMAIACQKMQEIQEFAQQHNIDLGGEDGSDCDDWWRFYRDELGWDEQG